MEIEVWSDVACPFCFIGKRSLESALAVFEHADEVAVRWRSFQLAPDMPATVDGDIYDLLARKYGTTREESLARSAGVERMAAEHGLELDLARVRPANTRDAHRLLQLAGARGRADDLAERLFTAYFTDGETVSDHATLTRVAVAAGLDAGEVADVLASDAYATEVAADQATAQGFGLQGVPAFVLDRRFGLTGAQPPEVIVQGLERAHALAGPDDGAAPASA